LKLLLSAFKKERSESESESQESVYGRFF